MDKSQFSISMPVKNSLDRFKAENKEKILLKYRPKRRQITNDLAVKYLLDVFGKRRVA